MQGGHGLEEYDPASPRTLVKCAWRCSREMKRFKWTVTVEQLMAVTRNIAWAFHLDEFEHRLVCEMAIQDGEKALGMLVYEEHICYDARS